MDPNSFFNRMNGMIIVGINNETGTYPTQCLQTLHARLTGNMTIAGITHPKVISSNILSCDVLFGGSSKKGIGGKSRPHAIFSNPQHSDGCQCQRGEGERREFFGPPPKLLSQLLLFPPHPGSSSKQSAAVAFHRNKTSQPNHDPTRLLESSIHRAQRGK